MNATLKQLESIDSGSNYKFGEKMESPSVPRSLFDLTHSNILTMKNAGQVVPLTWWECIQGDDYDITVDSLLRVLPQVVPLMSRQRLYVYAFYSRYSDLWNNYQVFMDRGYTGNVIKQIPCLQQGQNFRIMSEGNINPDSMLDYMGLPIGKSLGSLVGQNSSDSNHIRISALPFMMFLRVWRDYFMNRNEYINDRVLLPDDDSRFRLDDDGCLLSAKDQGKSFFFTEDSNYDFSIDSDGYYYFSGFYHEWPADYFTSALPFTQRGNAPTLDYKVDLSQLGLDFTDSIFKPETLVGNPRLVGVDAEITANTRKVGLYGLDSSSNPDETYTGFVKESLNKGKIVGSNIGLQIILEDIRKLAIAQTELEKLARTDGSYAQFGLTFFGEISKAAYDFRPTYIGGTYKNIAFTEVLQTSSSTAAVQSGEDPTPLGSMAGHGITGMSDNRIGHIHCDDNGIIMILGCIMPDVIYSEGIDRSFVESLQAEKYLPERAKLGLQPIYNYELFYAGNNSSSSGGDLYLWAHQNAYDHHRYKQNKIHGKVADPTNKSFYPFTQSRHFGHLINWGRNFSEAKDVRKSYLASSSEDAYVAQFKFNIRAVRPLPYRGTPAKII